MCDVQQQSSLKVKINQDDNSEGSQEINVCLQQNEQQSEATANFGPGSRVNSDIQNND